MMSMTALVDVMISRKRVEINAELCTKQRQHEK
jgi:hypothetical protein